MSAWIEMISDENASSELKEILKENAADVKKFQKENVVSEEGVNRK